MRSLLLGVCLLSIVVTFCRGDAAVDDHKGHDSWDDDADLFQTPNPIPVGFKEGPLKDSQIAVPSAGGTSHGSNYAGFNQACAFDSEPGKRCNPNMNLICDMRFCKCRNSTIEPDLVYTWSPEAAKCMQIARGAENWACEYDVQCQGSRLGRHSQCNYRSNSCECADADSLDRPTVRVNDICYLKKEIGSACTNDLECSSTIKGPAVCSGVRNAGICGCADGYSYDKLLDECLQVGKSEESICKSDRQCDDDAALGPLSRCNPVTGRCQCWDTKNNLEFVTAFYKLTHRCYYKRAENEDCEYREQCVLGFHRKSDCLVHPAYNDAKVCQCPEGQTCSGGDAAATISLLLLVISAFLVRTF